MFEISRKTAIFILFSGVTLVEVNAAELCTEPYVQADIRPGRGFDYPYHPTYTVEFNNTVLNIPSDYIDDILPRGTGCRLKTDKLYFKFSASDLTVPEPLELSIRSHSSHGSPPHKADDSTVIVTVTVDDETIKPDRVRDNLSTMQAGRWRGDGNTLVTSLGGFEYIYSENALIRTMTKCRYDSCRSEASNEGTNTSYYLKFDSKLKSKAEVIVRLAEMLISQWQRID